MAHHWQSTGASASPVDPTFAHQGATAVPTYEYACTNPEGKHEFEVVQSFSDAPVTECPVCGSRCARSTDRSVSSSRAPASTGPTAARAPRPRTAPRPRRSSSSSSYSSSSSRRRPPRRRPAPRRPSSSGSGGSKAAELTMRGGSAPRCPSTGHGAVHNLSRRRRRPPPSASLGACRASAAPVRPAHLARRVAAALLTALALLLALRPTTRPPPRGRTRAGRRSRCRARPAGRHRPDRRRSRRCARYPPDAVPDWRGHRAASRCCGASWPAVSGRGNRSPTPGWSAPGSPRCCPTGRSPRRSGWPTSPSPHSSARVTGSTSSPPRRTPPQRRRGRR